MWNAARDQNSRPQRKQQRKCKRQNKKWCSLSCCWWKGLFDFFVSLIFARFRNATVQTSAPQWAVRRATDTTMMATWHARCHYLIQHGVSQHCNKVSLWSNSHLRILSLCVRLIVASQSFVISPSVVSSLVISKFHAKTELSFSKGTNADYALWGDNTQHTLTYKSFSTSIIVNKVNYLTQSRIAHLIFSLSTRQHRSHSHTMHMLYQLLKWGNKLSVLLLQNKFEDYKKYQKCLWSKQTNNRINHHTTSSHSKSMFKVQSIDLMHFYIILLSFKQLVDRETIDWLLNQIDRCKHHRNIINVSLASFRIHLIINASLA